MKKRIGIWEDGWLGEDGYFTVEASVLVTIVFLLAAVVMLTGLYICDLNQAKSYLNRRVTELSLNEVFYDRDSLAEDREKLSRQLFVTKISDFVIVRSEKEVKGEVSLFMNMNVPMIGDWFGSLWTDTFALTVNVGDNVEMMRRWEQLE